MFNLNLCLYETDEYFAFFFGEVLSIALLIIHERADISLLLVGFVPGNFCLIGFLTVICGEKVE